MNSFSVRYLYSPGTRSSVQNSSYTEGLSKKNLQFYPNFMARIILTMTQDQVCFKLKETENEFDFVSFESLFSSVGSEKLCL